MKDVKLSGAVAVATATGLGLLTAAIDEAAPFGDDSAKLTVVLWLVFSGLMGFGMPHRPWRWAALVGWK